MSTSLPSPFQSHLTNVDPWTTAPTFLTDDVLKDHKITTTKPACRNEIISDLKTCLNIIFIQPAVPVPASELKAIYFHEHVSISLDPEGAGFDQVVFTDSLANVPHSIYSVESDGTGDALHHSDRLNFVHDYSFPLSSTTVLNPLFEITTSLPTLPNYFLLTKTGELILRVPERCRSYSPTTVSPSTFPLTPAVPTSLPLLSPQHLILPYLLYLPSCAILKPIAFAPLRCRLKPPKPQPMHLALPFPPWHGAVSLRLQKK